MKNPSFMTVSEAACNHFRGLLRQEEHPNLNLRIFVSKPATPHADVSITFCAMGEDLESDIALEFEEFTLFVEKASQPFLEEAVIDMEVGALNAQLSIKAPHLKTEPIFETLKDHIQYVIDSEIAPGLASHGGKVEIKDLSEDKVLSLAFGGGCQGCGMSQVTLKQGIERLLKERFPEILDIRDATDHTSGENPYYQAAEVGKCGG